MDIEKLFSNIGYSILLIVVILVFGFGIWFFGSIAYALISNGL